MDLTGWKSSVRPLQMEFQDHGNHSENKQVHHCSFGLGEPIMCRCDHTPGFECHCPPNEFKCDQEHHLKGTVQALNSCCSGNRAPNAN